MIVFLHRGPARFLAASVAQAIAASPGSRVVLLGDTESIASLRPLGSAVETHLARDYEVGSANFRDTYRHFSPNSEDFELFCFQRWIILDEFLSKDESDGPVLHLDSDYLLFKSESEVIEWSAGKLAFLNKMNPALSVFPSPKEVRDFSRFILDLFADDKSFNLFASDLLKSGFNKISDMEALMVFGKSRTTEDLGDRSREDVFFCENVSFSQGMEMGLFGKRIYRQGEELFFRKKSSGDFVLAGGVHLQGRAKGLWPIFLERNVRSLLSFSSNDIAKFSSAFSSILLGRMRQRAKKFLEKQNGVDSAKNYLE